jgi:hypothetical protein
MLIISTPEKANYSDKTGYKNPFHKKELYAEEFKALLKQFFAFSFICSQRSFSGSLIQYGQTEEISSIYSGQYDQIKKGFHTEPLYLIAYASDKSFEVPVNSIFFTPANITQQLAEQSVALKKTITYRTGNFLLRPFKFIHSLLKK